MTSAAAARERIRRLVEIHGAEQLITGEVPMSVRNVLSTIRGQHGRSFVNEVLVDALEVDDNAALTVGQAKRALGAVDAPDGDGTGEQVRQAVDRTLDRDPGAVETAPELSRSVCERSVGDGSLAEWVAARANALLRARIDDRDLAFELAWQDAAQRCADRGVTLSDDAFVAER